MKNIILISFLILTTHIKAQDPEIFDTTWYLYASSGETEVDPPIEADPCETPLSIYFEQNNTFHGRAESNGCEFHRATALGARDPGRW